MSLHETAGASLADLEQGARSPVDQRAAVPAAPADAAATSADLDEKNGSSETSRDDADAPTGRLDPSDAFTHHQLFYIFFLDGIGGMLVSGGVNFALAYVMYTTQDTTKHPIRLFQLPNTLAGDAAVTIIVQCILTWFVEKALVAYDLSRRSVQPIGFVPEPTVAWQRRLFFLDDGSSESEKSSEKASDEKGETKKATLATTIAGVIQQALRGFLLAVVGFFLLWPASVGILTAFGKHAAGDYTYGDRWTPQVFKFILGGLLGLLTTPLMAMFWLIKAGWEAKTGVPREQV